MKHGLSHTPEYAAWHNMIRRCTNPKHEFYKDYGGRGITICPAWKCFENFLADMGKRLTPKHTLERRNNNKGYEPDNCYWATMSQQAANRRNTKLCLDHAVHVIELKNDGYSLKALSCMFNIDEKMVSMIVKGKRWPKALASFTSK